MAAECDVLSVYDDIYLTFNHYDHKVIFGSSRPGISDVLSALNLASKDVLVDIAHSLYRVLAEQYGRFQAFCSFFRHFLYFGRTKLVIL